MNKYEHNEREPEHSDKYYGVLIAIVVLMMLCSESFVDWVI